MLSSQNPREGRLPAAIAALLALVLVAGVGLAKCSAPSPVPLVTPQPESRAEAAASTTATASQAVKVTIRRPTGYNGDSSAPGAYPAVRTTEQETPGGLSHEEIVIEVSQAMGAAASAEASASADHFRGIAEMVPAHGRIGVIAATMPGVLALDAQILRMDVPPWLLGMPLELGVDVAGNAQVGALGVTAGGKAFAGAWAWSRWNLSEQGLAGGVGLRF